MRRILTTLAVLAVIGTAGFWVLSRPAELPASTLAALRAHHADAANGARVFWAGGCAGCHAAPDIAFNAPIEERLVLGGGRRLTSDFGTFVAPNISMHTEAGIGGWTLEQFARAMLLGVSPAGAHYYPAFPYTTYLRAAPGDVADLWAFWQGLPADATPDQPHELAFPFTLRRGLGLWKRLYLDAEHPTAAPAEAQTTRGRYLVEALAHCGECHTSRGRLGGLDRARWLGGAPNPSGEGRIPAIPHPRWSAEDIEAYLFSGFTPEFDVVGGSMADVVVQMAQLPAEDRAAIAAYLRTLPPPDDRQ
ncbi:MAG: diacylglycerol kinase [Pararhodobacter sp.]